MFASDWGVWTSVALALLLTCVPRERSNEQPATDSGAKPRSSRRASRSFAGVEPPSPTGQTGDARRAPLGSGAIIELFVDHFDRKSVGRDYYATSNAWSLRQGRLCAERARNHPIWLRRRLPVNARIEFDAVSRSRDGDLKVEVWGDGRSHATGTSYDDATSYVLILGGWKNTRHILGRLGEHGSDRLETRVDSDGQRFDALPVVPNQTYHFKVERRDGRTVRFLVDDIEIHTLVDPEPLRGPGHEFMAFNDWEALVCFDNLEILGL